jgi:hypothetical protein
MHKQSESGDGVNHRVHMDHTPPGEQQRNILRVAPQSNKAVDFGAPVDKGRPANLFTRLATASLASLPVVAFFGRLVAFFVFCSFVEFTHAL